MTKVIVLMKDAAAAEHATLSIRPFLEVDEDTNKSVSGYLLKIAEAAGWEEDVKPPPEVNMRISPDFVTAYFVEHDKKILRRKLKFLSEYGIEYYVTP